MLWIDAAVKGTFVVLAAFTLTFCMRKSAAAWRHMVWSLAIVGLLALPFLSAVLPQWHVPLPESWSITAVEDDGQEVPARVEKLLSASPAAGNSERPTHVARATSSHSTQPMPPILTASEGIVSSSQPSALANGFAAHRRVPSPTPKSFATIHCWLALTWLAGASIVILNPLLGFKQLARLQRRATVVSDKACLELLDR